ncbi:hypothetical protein BASA83_013248 [Batrachochytrium salamandrivorans]|nr:hypothetical protein BASA83_013248 [Batrachochytrium salamandrivorans]
MNPIGCRAKLRVKDALKTGEEDNINDISQQNDGFNVVFRLGTTIRTFEISKLFLAYTKALKYMDPGRNRISSSRWDRLIAERRF